MRKTKENFQRQLDLFEQQSVAEYCKKLGRTVPEEELKITRCEVNLDEVEPNSVVTYWVDVCLIDDDKDEDTMTIRYKQDFVHSGYDLLR